MQYSYNDIVPEAAQNELIFIRDSSTRQSWRIADITAEVMAFNSLNERDVEKQQIYSAVGLFVGKASRTVREIYATGRFFAPELRETFGFLAFAHFRFAATLGERAIEALQWATEQTDELNRPATVDALIAHFTPPETEEETDEKEEEEKEPETIWQQMFRSASTQVMQANNWLNEDLPSKIISAIQDYADAAQALVERLPQEARR